jgi:hypothetical protein
LVTEGRRQEFSGLAGFADPASRERIADPQAPATFAASRLRWEERSREPHASLLRLHHDPLRLRRERESAFTVTALNEGALLLRCGWVSALVCLRGPWRVGLAPEASHVLLSTEDPAYAPDRDPPEVSAAARSVAFRPPGALVISSPGGTLA